ncbi:MAG: sugar phosphate isomerase/epimerase family protein [Acidobacteriaceae bacterium]
MLKVISTHIFLKHRLHAGHLDTLTNSGAEAIEIFANRRHFDYTSRTQVKEIGDWFRGNATPAWALHAPLRAEGEGESERSTAPAINVVHVEKSRRIDSMDEVKRALEAAEQVPFTHLILHLGERGDTWSPRTLEHGMTAVEHLRAFARPLGVQILLENLEKNEVAAPQNLMEILAVGHFDDIGICLDVGHAHLDDGIPSAIDTMGPRIRSVHVHDNAGDKDAHLWPGDGTIAWPETMRALESLAKPPATVLEIHPTLENPEGTLVDRFQRTWELLDRAASTAPDGR